MPEMPGVLLIDKPSGITSHDVVNQVRRQTGVKRVGHAGTLDPLATGLLIILVGRDATKKQAEFLHQDKEYICTAQLGIETDTYDSEGVITRRTPWERVKQLTPDQVESALAHFRGEIHQTVPAYSAVKVQGQKLYDKARRGTIDITALPSRVVKIYELELLDFYKDEAQQAVFLSLRVKCSSGTYIRSLVYDLGQFLGIGAYITALRRTKIGEFTVEDAQQLK